MGGSWELRKRGLRMVKQTILQYGDHRNEARPTLILRLLFGGYVMKGKDCLQHLIIEVLEVLENWGKMAILPKKSPRVPQCYPFPLLNLQNIPQIVETRGFNGVVQSWQLKSNRRPEYPSMWFGPLILKLVNPGVLIRVRFLTLSFRLLI